MSKEKEKEVSNKGSRDTLIENFHKRTGTRDRAFMIQQNLKYGQNIFNNVDVNNAPDDVLDDMVKYLDEEMDRNKREIFDNEESSNIRKQMRKEAAMKRYQKKLDDDTNKLNNIDVLYDNNLKEKSKIEMENNVKLKEDNIESTDLNLSHDIKTISNLNEPPNLDTIEIDKLTQISLNSTDNKMKLKDNERKLFEKRQSTTRILEDEDTMKPESRYDISERDEKRRELEEKTKQLLLDQPEIENKLVISNSIESENNSPIYKKNIDFDLPFYNKLVFNI